MPSLLWAFQEGDRDDAAMNHATSLAGGVYDVTTVNHTNYQPPGETF